MARRRRFYARDNHGRFAKTGKVYKKKTSTARKVAYGVGAVAIVGGAAVGGRELYRAGGRKGYEYGRAQGIKTGAPLRGPRGKFLKDEHKRDSSQNPFARGYRPVGKDGRARKAPKLRTFGDRIAQAERIAERRHTGKKGRKQTRTARKASQAASRVRERAKQRANSRRYNDAQTRSQRVGRAAGRARSAARAAGVDARLAGAQVRASRSRKTGPKAVKQLRKQSNKRKAKK